MSIFETIRSKIFGSTAAEAAPAAPHAASPAQAGPAAATTPAAAGQAVDVPAILDGLTKASSEKLDWRHSIVDLMKLLDMDSSHSARKQLAQELHYEGDIGDSGKMNVWLHKQVMTKLAANGGKVPPELVS